MCRGRIVPGNRTVERGKRGSSRLPGAPSPGSVIGTPSAVPIVARASSQESLPLLALRTPPHGYGLYIWPGAESPSKGAQNLVDKQPLRRRALGGLSAGAAAKLAALGVG